MFAMLRLELYMNNCCVVVRLLLLGKQAKVFLHKGHWPLSMLVSHNLRTLTNCACRILYDSLFFDSP